MSAQDAVTVSAAVMILVQFVKWQGLPDKRGPLAVLAISLLGVALWAYTKGNFTRETTFDYFMGWLSVSLSAAGIFGFTRSSAGAVTNLKAPPNDGAGSSSTNKP